MDSATAGNGNLKRVVPAGTERDLPSRNRDILEIHEKNWLSQDLAPHKTQRRYWRLCGIILRVD
jgi:hypothetical protein